MQENPRNVLWIEETKVAWTFQPFLLVATWTLDSMHDAEETGQIWLSRVLLVSWSQVLKDGGHRSLFWKAYLVTMSLTQT